MSDVEAAVDLERDAGDEGGFVGRKPERGVGHVEKIDMEPKPGIEVHGDRK